MKESAPEVIVIPAKMEYAQQVNSHRQLRVAAYCRVSTDDEEQLTSYEAQKNYYTEKIMTNPKWTMAGIFADEGITGTSARKRPEFLRMIRLCKQKKVDLVLTKSISRFARNTVDCLNYIRILRGLGISVIFEKENINTMESDSEIIITLLGAFAQSESESISANVKWGIRQAFREGRACIHYNQLYGYRKGVDGKPEPVPEQAVVVTRIFEAFLLGSSVRMIKEMLEHDSIVTVNGGTVWSTASIRGILANEKYCGDVILQKTFIEDCLSKKVVKNTGQLPKILLRNHHAPIVSRSTYDAVQVEMARRNAVQPSSAVSAPTGRSCYSAKYALTERLFCGECGTRYRRYTWNGHGKKRIVWRCVSRVDYGTKYCHNSPVMDEIPLQDAIMAALNSRIYEKKCISDEIAHAFELETAPLSTGSLSLADIDRRLREVNDETRSIIEQAADEDNLDAFTDRFQLLKDEAASLKIQRDYIQEQRKSNEQAIQRLTYTNQMLKDAPFRMDTWDETLIRQLVDSVKVVSADKIIVYLRTGEEIEQELHD